VYCRNNPLKYVDPNGKTPTSSLAEIQSRQHQLENAIGYLTQCPDLDQETKNIAEEHQWVYNNVDNLQDAMPALDDLGPGKHSVIGWNDKGFIWISSIFWNNQNNLNLWQFLKTILHEIQHDKTDNTQHNTEPFDNEVSLELVTLYKYILDQAAKKKAEKNQKDTIQQPQDNGGNNSNGKNNGWTASMSYY